MKTTFSHNLKQARKLKGWTQDQAAGHIRIKRATLAAYEEARAFPPAITLSGISEAYNVQDDLYGFINNIDFYDEKGRRRNIRKLSDFEKKYHSLNPSRRQAIDALMGI